MVRCHVLLGDSAAQHSTAASRITDHNSYTLTQHISTRVGQTDHGHRLHLATAAAAAAAAARCTARPTLMLLVVLLCHAIPFLRILALLDELFQVRLFAATLRLLLYRRCRCLHCCCSLFGLWCCCLSAGRTSMQAQAMLGV